MNNDFFDLCVANGKFVLTENQFHPAYYKTYKIKTVKDCADEDWKTDLIHQKKRIPKGTEFDNYRIFKNLYGTYLDVRYEGNLYSIKPGDVELIKITS